VGADAPRAIDVRIVAATHQDLEARIREGRFRQDLLFRLDVMPIRVPALRERREDIPVLVEHFLARLLIDHPTSRLRRSSPELLQLLEQHSWPGNVRELKNLIERLAIVCDHEEATREDVRGLLAGSTSEPSTVSFPRDPILPLRELEEAYIGFVVDECDGNKTKAAEILGIDVSTIHRRTKKDPKAR